MVGLKGAVVRADLTGDVRADLTGPPFRVSHDLLEVVRPFREAIVVRDTPGGDVLVVVGGDGAELADDFAAGDPLDLALGAVLGELDDVAVSAVGGVEDDVVAVERKGSGKGDFRTLFKVAAEGAEELRGVERVADVAVLEVGAGRDEDDDEPVRPSLAKEAGLELAAVPRSITDIIRTWVLKAPRGTLTW